MAQMTMIARVVDGLPLVGTMQKDEQSGKNFYEYSNQAKMLFRKLGPQSPTRCTIQTDSYYFHYLIENEVCYLVLCDKMYSKRLAFNYLEEIAQEFQKQFGRKVNTVTRPYAFIEFDVYLQKASRSISDCRRNINQINSNLQDVQKIMFQNIEDVLQRGAILSELDTKTQHLAMASHKYKKDATYLNTKSMYVKGAVASVIVLVFILYFWVL